MRLFGALDLIYDARCAFCVRTLNIFRTLDAFGTLRFHDAHDLETLKKRFPILRGADVDEAMYVITEDERIYRGFFAFRRLAWSSPLTWPLVPLFCFPGSGFFGPRIYAWVARNRTNLGCQSEVCALPGQTLVGKSQDKGQWLSL